MAEQIKGLTIKLGLDNKDFKKELNQSQREIRGTTTQVNSLQRALKFEFDGKKFSEAQKQAQKAIDLSISKSEKLRSEIKKMDELGVDKTTASYMRLENELIKSETQTINLKAQLEAVNKIKVDKLEKGFKDVGKTISDVGKALAPLSLAAGSIVTGLIAVTKSTSKTVAELSKVSNEVGISTVALQKWQYVASQTGIDNSTLQNSLSKVNIAFNHLATGEITKATKSLERLGVDSNIAAENMEDSFEVVLKTLENVSDKSLRASLANEIFGESLGSKILPILNEGSEGINKLVSEFEELGFITEEQIDSFNNYNNQWTKIKKSMESVKNDLASAMIPVMTSLSNTLEKKVVPSMEKLSEWFTSLSEKSRGILIGTLALVAGLAPVIMIIGKLTTGVGSLITTISKIGPMLSILSTHPIIGVIAGITALIITLYNTNEEFRLSIEELVSVIGSSLAPFLEIISNLFTEVLSKLMPLISTIGSVLTPIIQIITSLIGPLIQMIGIYLLPYIIKLEAMFYILSSAIEPVTRLLEGLGVAFSWVAEEMGKSIDWIITNVINKGLSAIEGFVNGGINLLNGLIRSINKMGGWLGISLKELDNISLQIKTSTEITNSPTPQISQSPSVNEAISSKPNYSKLTNNQSSINNIDNSNKNITLNLTVQNYGEELDYDDVFEKFQMKLASEM